MSGGIRRALLRAEPGGDRFLEFENPVESLVAAKPDDVPGLLARAEEGAARGLWAVGFVGYEAAPAFDDALRTQAAGGGPAPLAAFSLFAAVREREPPAAGRSATIGAVRRALGEDDHADGVAAIRSAIAAGETYQVNYVFPLEGEFHGGAEELFADLLSPGEAPFATLLLGERWAVASLSPELFFERDGGRVVMRPMKGTRPRGRFGAEDRQRAGELSGSAKDRAENLMIVDMVRNDLGRIAEPGSVVVERAFEIERYPTVWQMTSTVAARTAAGLPDLFAALFPCASVTGAPKPATMRLIRELEGRPRGVYCGAAGFVEPGGRARFAVAIRTLELDLAACRFRYGVGSGVTWDSEPAAEWRECLDKARVLDGPRPEFELLETMRFRPGKGIELLDLHLERVAESAEFFGFSAAGEGSGEAGMGEDRKEKKRDSVEGIVRAELLARCAALPPRAHRVRAQVAGNGLVRLEVSPFERENRAWRVALAGNPVSSLDSFLFHKTTRRAPYEAALASAPAGVDEVLLVNEHGELTEGTRTNLFLQIDGEWLTPPRSAGLLAGVFREHLMRSGEVVEATLYPRDLVRAHRIRLGNALRGWIAVERPVLDADGRPLTG